LSLKTSPHKLKKSSPKSIVGSEALHRNSDDITNIKTYNKANSDKDEKHSITRKKVLWAENSMKPKAKI
jgi:hypothetical protein